LEEQKKASGLSITEYFSAIRLIFDTNFEITEKASFIHFVKGRISAYHSKSHVKSPLF